MPRNPRQRARRNHWVAMQERRRKSHDGKERLTKANAIQMMHEIANRTGDWISAYDCRFCEWWHVGNANPGNQWRQ